MHIVDDGVQGVGAEALRALGLVLSELPHHF
jgi:hypothetical protein